MLCTSLVGNVPTGSTDTLKVEKILAAVALIVVCYQFFGWIVARRPRFEVSAVSDSWLQQQRGTSGDPDR
jgi:hypothetical protein